MPGSTWGFPVASPNKLSCRRSQVQSLSLGTPASTWPNFAIWSPPLAARQRKRFTRWKKVGCAPFCLVRSTPPISGRKYWPAVSDRTATKRSLLVAKRDVDSETVERDHCTWKDRGGASREHFWLCQ